MAVEGIPGLLRWAPNTKFFSGERFAAPNGDIVSVNVDFTSGATYSATNVTASNQDGRIHALEVLGGITPGNTSDAAVAGLLGSATQTRDAFDARYVNETDASGLVAGMVTNAGPTRDALDARYVNETDAAGMVTTSGSFQTALDTRFAPDAGGKPVGKGELVINVKDHGAKGDGVTDDTAFINAARTAAGPGGVLWFPLGTYIASTLSIGASIDFRGHPGATIKQKPMTNNFLVKITAAGVTFRAQDITFDQNNGGQTAGAGRFLFNSAVAGATSEFRNVTFRDFCEGALRIAGDRVSTTREALRVFNCKFRGGTESTSGTYDTFTIFAADASELTVCDSDFDHGLTIAAQGIPAITVGATVTESADYTEVTIRNNRFKGYGRFTVGSGVGVIDTYAWATRLEVSGNKFIGSRVTPIRGKVNAQNAVITGNMMTDFVGTGTDFGFGISLVSATLAPVGGNYEIASNVIVGAPETAINVSHSSGTVKNINVHDNIIDTPGVAGITVVRVENVNIHDNIIRTAGTQGITLSSCAGKGKIGNNTIAGAGLTGIQTIGDQPILDLQVVGNFVEAATASGITIENVRSLSLQGNTVKDTVDGGGSGQRGYRIGGSTSGIGTGQMKNNTAIGTFATGIYSLIGLGFATLFEEGNSWNSQKGYGSAAPNSGTWARGSIIWNTAPAAGGTIGWICVTAGTPGTWKTFGTIAA